MCQKLMSKPLKGHKLSVKLVREVPVAIDPKRLLISDIPQSADEEFLTLFVESRFGMKADENFRIVLSPPRAVLTFVCNHSEEGRS